MSKDIWHTTDETPGQESRVVWKSGNVICGGRFDTHYKCFCGPASQFVDLKRVSRWAYLDDLLALEPELDRTHKALDVAVDALGYYASENSWDETNRWMFVENGFEFAKDALEQITAEQKE